MKLLIFGGTGMLGHKLIQILREKFDVWTTVRSEFSGKAANFLDEDKIFRSVDVENFEVVENVIENLKPNIIINAVGVIKQLPTSKDVVKTLTINSIFPHRLAQIAQKQGFKLITVGTDCVFSGASGNYTEDDAADAPDLYGRSKHFGEVGERNCLTLRTSIIGRELDTAHSLVEWFLSNRGGKVKGFKNAIYSGFPTVIFAGIIADLIEKHPNLEGLYHVSSEPINKFDLLSLINKAYSANVEIERFADFHIDRSLNSDKFRRATGFEPLSWEEMVEKMANDPTDYGKNEK